MANAILIEGWDWCRNLATSGGLLSKPGWTYTGTNSVANMTLVAGRFGGQALRMADGSGNTGHFTYTFSAPYTRFGIGLAYRHADVANGSNPFIKLLDSAGADQLWLRMDSSGSVSLYRGATQIATSAGAVFVTGTWHWVSWLGELSDSSGTCEVWVDNVKVIDFAGDTVQTANVNYQRIRVECPDQVGSNNFSYHDDLIVFDDKVKVDEGTVFLQVPNADTANKSFTPSTGTDNFACVDEAPSNVTDYVQGSTVGDLDLYEMTDLAVTPLSILAVEALVLAQKTDAGTRSMAVVVDDGGSVAQSADFSVPASTWRTASMILTNKPSGGAWTASAVNALKAGPKVTV